MSEKGSGVREVTEKILAGAKVSARVVMELGENEAMKRAVASGLGIALISAIVARRELEAGQIQAVRLPGARILRKFNIIHHKDKYISKLIRAFMDDALRFSIAGPPGGKRTCSGTEASVYTRMKRVKNIETG
jgi:DNA-binding transcriptional LysR family regulator